MFADNERDDGRGFIRLNDISPATSEVLDSEIKRLLQVKCHFVLSCSTML